MSFFTDASFVMDPNVYGVGKLYVPKPTDGSGDLTFSRASTGTRVNQDGLIEKVRTRNGRLGATDYIPTTTSAVSVGPLANIPRLNYGSDGCPSLLLEPQRTNAFLYSNQPEGTGWDRVNCTFQTGFAGPDGYNSARKLTATSNDSVFYYQNTSVTSGTSYTASVYVKSAGKRYFQITGSSGFAGNEYVNFDLQTGTIVYESGSALTGKIEALTDGWYRVSVTQIATSTTSGRFILALIDTATAGRLGVVTADGNGILVWEDQMEASSYPTSIIPTLGSAVTRLADACSKTGISSLIGQSEGTLYWEGYVTPAGGWNSLLSVEVLGAVFINLRLDPSNQIQLGSGNLSSDSQALLFKTRLSNADLARLTSL
jgi:hypothetical protein